MSINVRKGFFIIKGDNKEALNKVLMLSAFRSKCGTCLIQSWILGFNPQNTSNLAFPTWVSLRNKPFEHQDQALAIVGSLGEVIGVDMANDHAKDPRFCINLEMSKGWVTSTDLESKADILPSQTIMVDNDNLPIRCRVCLSWKHKAIDCKEFQKQPVRGWGWTDHTLNNQNQNRALHGNNGQIDRNMSESTIFCHFFVVYHVLIRTCFVNSTIVAL